MLWDLWGSGVTGVRKAENMHWLKAKDSPIQSRPKEHQLFCILTQRLITRKCVWGGWQMQMETDSDKNDNGIALRGGHRGGGGMLFRIFNNWYGGSEMLFDPGEVWMSPWKNSKDFEVKYINVTCAHLCVHVYFLREKKCYSLKWLPNKF